MMRSETWHADLAEYIVSVGARPFAWGTHDCATFAAGAVQAMTGEDFVKPYQGKYRSLRGGLGLLKRKGFATHADLAASLFEEIHPSLARVGDLAAVPVDDAALIALGVTQGERIFVLRPTGIGTVDLLSATRAFRI